MPSLLAWDTRSEMHQRIIQSAKSLQPVRYPMRFAVKQIIHTVKCESIVRCRSQLRGQVPDGHFLEVHVAGDYANATWATFIDFLYQGGDAALVGCWDVEELLRCAIDNKFHKLQVRALMCACTRCKMRTSPVFVKGIASAASL